LCNGPPPPPPPQVLAIIPAPAAKAQPKAKSRGKGGSVLMTMANSRRKALRLSLGRTLTAEELAGINEEVRGEWATMSDEVRAVHTASYQHEREARSQQRCDEAHVSTEIAEAQRYKSHFGFVGNPSLPLQASSFAVYHKENGFPTNLEVFKSTEFVVFKEDTLTELKGVGKHCADI
jgi:hypothetical protein